MDPLALRDATQALNWFQTEYQCLLAAQQAASCRDWHTSVWLLAWALTDYQRWRARPEDYIAVWKAGANSADSLGSAQLRAWAYRQLGQALSRIHDPASADFLDRALAHAEQIDDFIAKPPHNAASHTSTPEAATPTGHSPTPDPP